MIFESWFIIFPKGWPEGLSTIGSKLYLWWLAGSLANFLACFLAAFLACLPACKVVAYSGLPAWLARLLACLLADWRACPLAPCPLACWLACLLACFLASLLPCVLASLLPCLACLLVRWLHCERMIGEKNPLGRGKNPGKNSAPRCAMLHYVLDHSVPTCSAHILRESQEWKKMFRQRAEVWIRACAGRNGETTVCLPPAMLMR